MWRIIGKNDSLIQDSDVDVDCRYDAKLSRYDWPIVVGKLKDTIDSRRNKSLDSELPEFDCRLYM